MRVIIFIFGLSDFLRYEMKSTSNKEKNGNSGTSLKLESTLLQRITLRKWKENPLNCRKCLQIAYQIKDSYEGYLNMSYNTVMKRQLAIKRPMDLNKPSSKEDIWIVNKHMKRCSKLSVIREM